MTSFNDNDGVPSGNEFILKQVLRKDEWGFDGFVVSDWASIKRNDSSRICRWWKRCCKWSCQCGVDMEMVSYTYMTHLKDLIKEERWRKTLVNEAVRNILRIKFRRDFWKPYVDENVSRLCTHRNIWRLPNGLRQSRLYCSKTMEFAVERNGENGSCGWPYGRCSLRANGYLGSMAIKHIRKLLWKPSAQYGDKVNVIYEAGLDFSRDKNTAGIARAAAAAARADVVLAFVGEESILSGEAHCLADLNLQGHSLTCWLHWPKQVNRWWPLSWRVARWPLKKKSTSRLLCFTISIRVPWAARQ